MRSASACKRATSSRMKKLTAPILVLFIVLMGLAGIYAESYAQTPKTGAKPMRLVSVRVNTAPTVDGRGNDSVWRSAKPLEIVAKRVMAPNIGLSTRASVRSVHTDTHIYFLVSWEDATEDISHKSWVWNVQKGL